MKFFVPAARDHDEAESVWQATRQFAFETLGWSVNERRIFRIHYRHDGVDGWIEVGKPQPYTGEVVITILDSNTYLVCTASRGVVRGQPILIGHEEALSVEDFEATA